MLISEGAISSLPLSSERVPASSTSGLGFMQITNDGSCGVLQTAARSAMLAAGLSLVLTPSAQLAFATPWIDVGGQVQSVQPPHHGTEREIASIFKGDDGTQAPFVNWKNAGWEIQPPQPPHRAPERDGATLAGAVNIEAVYTNWKNAGWEVQSVQPPVTHQNRAAAIAPLVTIDAVYRIWRNTGWEQTATQPPHPRPEKFALLNWAFNIDGLFSVQRGVLWHGPTRGLTHRWPMDDANVSGTTVLDVVGGLNGTAGSDVSSATGPVTQSRDIGDTANGYITLPSAPVDFTAPFSIGVWLWRSSYAATFDGAAPKIFNFNNAGNTSALAGSLRQTPGGTIVTGSIAFQNDTSTIERSTNAAGIPLGTWAHVCFTWDGATGTIYVNGSSVASSVVSDLSAQVGTSWVIGARQVGARPWGGRMYQFVSYNLVLSAQEAIQLATADAPVITWQNSGAEVLPFQPPVGIKQMRGAMLRGDDGIQAPFISTLLTASYPWGYDCPLVYTRHNYAVAGAIAGPLNIEARYVNWRNVGWEVQPPPPPHFRPEQRGAFLRGDDGITARFALWRNYGWDAVLHQPQHPRPERSGVQAIGDSGIEAPQITALLTSAYPWGYDEPYVFPRVRYERAGATMRGDDGITARYINWSVMGFEVQPPQPPRPMVLGRFAGIVRGDDGTQYPLNVWTNDGWEQVASMPIHIRYERASVENVGDVGDEAPFLRWLNSGWEVMPVQPPHRNPPARTSFAAIAPFSFVESVYVRWRNAGWEVAPVQPPITRQFRAGTLRFHYDPLQPYTNWLNSGWQATLHDLPHPAPEKRAGAILRGDDGIEAALARAFKSLGWDSPPVIARKAYERAAALIQYLDAQGVYVSWKNLGFEIAPPQLRARHIVQSLDRLDIFGPAIAVLHVQIKSIDLQVLATNDALIILGTDGDFEVLPTLGDLDVDPP